MTGVGGMFLPNGRVSVEELRASFFPAVVGKARIDAFALLHSLQPGVFDLMVPGP